MNGENYDTKHAVRISASVSQVHSLANVITLAARHLQVTYLATEFDTADTKEQLNDALDIAKQLTKQLENAKISLTGLASVLNIKESK